MNQNQRTESEEGVKGGNDENETDLIRWHEEKILNLTAPVGGSGNAEQTNSKHSTLSLYPRLPPVEKTSMQDDEPHPDKVHGKKKENVLQKGDEDNTFEMPRQTNDEDLARQKHAVLELTTMRNDDKSESNYVFQNPVVSHKIQPTETTNARNEKEIATDPDDLAHMKEVILRVTSQREEDEDGGNMNDIESQSSRGTFEDSESKQQERSGDEVRLIQRNKQTRVKKKDYEGKEHTSALSADTISSDQQGSLNDHIIVVNGQVQESHSHQEESLVVQRRENEIVRPGAQWIRGVDATALEERTGTVVIGDVPPTSPISHNGIEDHSELPIGTTFAAELFRQIPSTRGFPLTPQSERLQHRVRELEEGLEDGRCKLRKIILTVFVVGSLAILSAILGVVLGTQLNKKHPDEQQPSPSPAILRSTSVPTETMRPSSSSSPSWSPSQSILPTTMPTIILEKTLVTHIQSVRPTISFADPLSAQSRALEWLLNDRYVLETQLSGDALVQRFAVVTFTFSTNGEVWNPLWNWLSPINECRWPLVSCDHKTGVMQAINLGGMKILSGTLPPEISLLKHLRVLDVHYNALSGTLPPEVGELTELTTLVLNYNNFTGTIPSELSQLSSLRELPINNNFLTGTLPSHVLSSLTHLAQLYLDENQLTGSLPTEVGCLTALTSFNIGMNELTGTLPSEVGKLSNIMLFGVAHNRFRGTPPAEVWNLTNLLVLNLAANKFTGTLPTALGLLTRLTDLRLFQNHFTGSFPVILTLLGDLSHLEISSNKFSGSIPAELGRLTKLTYLQMSRDGLGGSLPTELGLLTELLFLSVAMNNLVGTVPTEIGRLSKLRNLRMFQNNLGGSLPTEMGHLMNLEHFGISTNELSSTVPSEMGLMTKLTYLRIFTNNLSGSFFSEGLGCRLTNLLDVDVSENLFTGTICTELGLMTRLMSLLLAQNDFIGSLPSEVGRLVDLGFMVGSGNRLESLPTELGLLTQLTSLQMHANHLEGQILTELGHLTDLLYLSLAHNRFSGRIPSEIGRLTQLDGLLLEINNLEGPVPTELYMLTNLNCFLLYGNDLSGTIPKSVCLNVFPQIDCGEIVCSCCRDENNAVCA